MGMVMAQNNPVTGNDFYAIMTTTINDGMLHPDNFYVNEKDAYEGLKSLAEFMLAYVSEQDADRGKGRRPLMLGNWENEANQMLGSYAQFQFDSR